MDGAGVREIVACVQCQAKGDEGVLTPVRVGSVIAIGEVIEVRVRRRMKTVARGSPELICQVVRRKGAVHGNARSLYGG